ncbi:hypothetical protein QC760_007506 [Botrytis cinerea]
MPRCNKTIYLHDQKSHQQQNTIQYDTRLIMCLTDNQYILKGEREKKKTVYQNRMLWYHNSNPLAPFPLMNNPYNPSAADSLIPILCKVSICSIIPNPIIV